MLSEAITMTVLTHPLQVLLVGMIVSRLAREALGGVTAAQQVRPVADRSDLRAA